MCENDILNFEYCLSAMDIHVHVHVHMMSKDVELNVLEEQQGSMCIMRSYNYKISVKSPA